MAGWRELYEKRRREEKSKIKNLSLTFSETRKKNVTLKIDKPSVSKLISKKDKKNNKIKDFQRTSYITPEMVLDGYIHSTARTFFRGYKVVESHWNTENFFKNLMNEYYKANKTLIGKLKKATDAFANAGFDKSFIEDITKGSENNPIEQVRSKMKLVKSKILNTEEFEKIIQNEEQQIDSKEILDTFNNGWKLLIIILTELKKINPKDISTDLKSYYESLKKVRKCWEKIFPSNHKIEPGKSNLSVLRWSLGWLAEAYTYAQILENFMAQGLDNPLETHIKGKGKNEAEKAESKKERIKKYKEDFIKNFNKMLTGKQLNLADIVLPFEFHYKVIEGKEKQDLKIGLNLKTDRYTVSRSFSFIKLLNANNTSNGEEMLKVLDYLACNVRTLQRWQAPTAPEPGTTQIAHLRAKLEKNNFILNRIARLQLLYHIFVSNERRYGDYKTPSDISGLSIEQGGIANLYIISFLDNKVYETYKIYNEVNEALYSGYDTVEEYYWKASKKQINVSDIVSLYDKKREALKNKSFNYQMLANLERGLQEVENIKKVASFSRSTTIQFNLDLSKYS